MPKVNDIEDKGLEGLKIAGLPWLQKAIGSDLIRGGIYLVAGEPGIGKTTLSIQVLVEGGTKWKRRQSLIHAYRAKFKGCKGGDN